MADIDLERFARLRALHGKAAQRSVADVRSAGARFKAESRGLAAAASDARRERTQAAAADGTSLRDALAAAMKRSSRT